jgi:hypothetical protein
VHDVYTAMETLLADLGQDSGLFDRWVYEVGVLSMSHNGLYLGVMSTISVALPMARLMPLSLIPILSNPESEALNSCQSSRANMTATTVDACDRASQLGTAWTHVINLVAVLPSTVDPQAGVLFERSVVLTAGRRTM